MRPTRSKSSRGTRSLSLASCSRAASSALAGVTFSGWSPLLAWASGFGLQEIVANFVSGLIVLAERPIRIGDVVTVGNVSGTVSRIQARATVVVDFDSKEVIIPNKAFITEHVVNWTLSDQTTRLLIKVGVAYGSDIALVQRVILAAVQGNRDVLQDPAPSVFLVAFGESTLDFEIRAFVNSFDKRLRVQHEIHNDVARVLQRKRHRNPVPAARSAHPLGAGARWRFERRSAWLRRRNDHVSHLSSP